MMAVGLLQTTLCPYLYGKGTGEQRKTAGQGYRWLNTSKAKSPENRFLIFSKYEREAREPFSCFPQFSLSAFFRPREASAAAVASLTLPTVLTLLLAHFG